MGRIRQIIKWFLIGFTILVIIAFMDMDGTLFRSRYPVKQYQNNEPVIMQEEPNYWEE